MVLFHGLMSRPNFSSAGARSGGDLLKAWRGAIKGAVELSEKASVRL